MKRALVTVWGPFLAALVVVFWLSSLPNVSAARYVWDKILHVVEYAALGVLALRAFHGGIGRLRLAATLGAGAAVILWGISDEIHQHFVPGREASALDVLADAIGFAVAVGAVTLWISWRGRTAPARRAAEPR